MPDYIKYIYKHALKFNAPLNKIANGAQWVTLDSNCNGIEEVIFNIIKYEAIDFISYYGIDKKNEK